MSTSPAGRESYVQTTWCDACSDASSDEATFDDSDDPDRRPSWDERPKERITLTFRDAETNAWVSFDDHPAHTAPFEFTLSAETLEEIHASISRNTTTKNLTHSVLQSIVNINGPERFFVGEKVQNPSRLSWPVQGTTRLSFQADFTTLPSHVKQPLIQGDAFSHVQSIAFDADSRFKTWAAESNCEPRRANSSEVRVYDAYSSKRREDCLHATGLPVESSLVLSCLPGETIMKSADALISNGFHPRSATYLADKDKLKKDIAAAEAIILKTSGLTQRHEVKSVNNFDIDVFARTGDTLVGPEFDGTLWKNEEHLFHDTEDQDEWALWLRAQQRDAAEGSDGDGGQVHGLSRCIAD